MGNSRQDRNPPRLVVVGEGMSASCAVESLLERLSYHCRVTVFGVEPRVGHKRVTRSAAAASEIAHQNICAYRDDWHAHNGVTVKGETVVAIDRRGKTVRTARGHVEKYDKLIIAAGSTPFALSVPGVGLPGVVAFHDPAPVDATLRQAQERGRAVVIGGGPFGLEAAARLKAKGLSVSVVHFAPTLMDGQLNAFAGQMLRQAIEQRGVEVFSGANVQAIIGKTKVEGVKLDGGRVIAAEMVVIATGTLPDVRLAREAGLVVERGVKIDDAMRTSDADIYAIGECVEHRGHCYGSGAPLIEMAKVLARQIAGDSSAVYRGSATSIRLNIADVDLFSAGDISEHDDEIILRDPHGGIYRRIVLQDNRIAGVTLYGDTKGCCWFFELLREGVDIEAMRDTLIFGPAYQGGPPLNPMAAVVASPDNAEIAGCNGINGKRPILAIEDGEPPLHEDLRASVKVLAHRTGASRPQRSSNVDDAIVSVLERRRSIFDPYGHRQLCRATARERMISMFSMKNARIVGRSISGISHDRLRSQRAN